LSVEISKIGSSRFTGSPTYLIQRESVPSAMDSPIWGMITSMVAIPLLLVGGAAPPRGSAQYAATHLAARTMSVVCGSTKSSSCGA
jgi:hypothetical protein